MGMVPGQKSISAVIHAYINTGLLYPGVLWQIKAGIKLIGLQIM
jgi:hypothetical protein